MMKKKTKKKANKKITKNMTLLEVVQKKPEAAEILAKAGMHCFGCGMAAYETLEQGCRGHNIDVKKIVKEINEI